MNIMEHESLLHAREYFGYMPRRGIAGSSGSVMSSFLRNRQTNFHSGSTILQSHQQWRSVPLSPCTYEVSYYVTFYFSDIICDSIYVCVYTYIICKYVCMYVCVCRLCITGILHPSDKNGCRQRLE